MDELSQQNYWNSEEFENALISFEAIQEELNYQKAHNTLRDLVNHFDLSPREKQGLEQEIDHLSSMLEKLDNAVIQIAAFGMVGRGKSSILNALIGQPIFEAGPLHGVTKTIESAQWKVSQDENLANVQRITLSSWGNSQIQLIDTPGIDEVDGETREALARDIAQKTDLILFIIAGDLSKVEYNALSQLREVGKPMLLVFNKIDQYPETDRLAIYEKIRDERVKEILSPDEIVMVAANPLLSELVKDSSGKVKRRQSRSEPQVTELKLKIVELLQREGKSLVALNTLLCADIVNEKFVQRKIHTQNNFTTFLTYYF